MFEHNRAVAELLNKAVFSLNGWYDVSKYTYGKLRKIKTLTGVGNLSNFVTVEAVPIRKISKCG